MKTNKGYTLIELLAIIVVLAIILSITVPSITGIIKSSTKNAFNSDAKMVLKAIEYKKLNNDNFNPLEVTKENMQETIGLNSDNYKQINFSLDDDAIKVIIVGENKWEGLIAYGTIRNMIVVDSENYDDIPPSITILGDNPANIGRGTVYMDAGATVVDLQDGPVDITSTVIRDASNVVVSNIDTSTFTTYTITYTAVDSNGNEASSVRRVNVVDKTEPVITILGDNPTTININDVYSDAGATALDDVDGDITSKIEITGTINPSVVGTYTITYTVNDSANNQTVAIRTVNVIDNVIPTVVFGTNGNTTYAKKRSTTVTVSDNVEVNISSLRYQWTTSITTPTEISFNLSFTNGETINTPSDATGEYYLWILGKDASGNMMIERSNVFNLDNTIPVITMNGVSPVSVNLGSNYTDAGATANDNIDGSISVSLSSTINVNVVGTYTITYTAIDSSGNEATPVVRIINVIDVSAPVITILGINPVSINLGSTYTDAGATALDDVDGDVTSKIGITGTVNPSIVGTYTITYTVKDNANNQAVATRTVHVLDNVSPTVIFSMNGNTTYAKNRSTTVTVSDNVSVNASSLRYQWTTSTTAPTEASFSISFTNGGTISTPTESTGGYYLWVLAKDTNNNTMISRSDVFNLDNIAPVIILNGDSTISISSGGTYTDAGAYASELHSGLAGTISVSSNVNPNVVGTYTVTYNVSDNAGNVATPVTRTVYIFNVENNYAYTGGVQTLVVPQGITKVQLEVWGAQGGTCSDCHDYDGNTKYGGAGGYSRGTFTVTPGQTLYIYVGGMNGWNGGGGGGGGGWPANYGSGGNGGGASDVRLGGTTLNDRIIVAGGGGGNACTGNCGGVGGGLSGGAGTIGSSYENGQGGTQTAGGAGGVEEANGSAGGFGYGGGGASYFSGAEWYGTGGGGGGGGWYGGGGGGYASRAGGGGSGYIKAGATMTDMQTGVHGGNGYVRITDLN